MDIALQEVSLTIQGRAILGGVTAAIQGGKLTCLLGANGAGKTTLLRILAGELKPTSGSVLLGENDLSSRRQKEIARHFAVVPQSVGDPPHLTVRELVSLGRFRPTRSLWWSLSAEDRKAVEGYIARCQLERLADRPVAQLSGGEKQRAWLAFSLAQEKEFLVLDEALDALDFMARRAFFHLLGDVVAGERGVLLTTHDLGLATEFASRIVILNAGRVAYQGPPTTDLDKLIGSTVVV